MGRGPVGGRFLRFEEEAYSIPRPGAFRTYILTAGGSKDPMELVYPFRGREPAPEPLLRHSGIASCPLPPEGLPAPGPGSPPAGTAFLAGPEATHSSISA